MYPSCIYVLIDRIRLEDEAEELSKRTDTNNDRLLDIYERLEELDAITAETKAARILYGLGKCGMGSFESYYFLIIRVYS